MEPNTVIWINGQWLHHVYLLKRVVRHPARGKIRLIKVWIHSLVESTATYHIHAMKCMKGITYIKSWSEHSLQFIFHKLFWSVPYCWIQGVMLREWSWTFATPYPLKIHPNTYDVLSITKGTIITFLDGQKVTCECCITGRLWLKVNFQVEYSWFEFIL